MNLKCLAFDLDDTLLDTSGLLLPRASRQACEAMVTRGLACTTEQCMKLRSELAKEMSHREIFLEIARKFGRKAMGGDIEPMAKAGVEVFYNPHIPGTLNLLPTAIENLKILEKKYTLFLVTTGAPETQAKKIQAAGLRRYFKKIYIMNGFKDEKKRTAFEDILKTEKIDAPELLSVGNRLFEEIRQAKQLGSQTCYFKYGDHVGEIPQVPEDHPDFTVLSHKELITTCQL